MPEVVQLHGMSSGVAGAVTAQRSGQVLRSSKSPDGIHCFETLYDVGVTLRRRSAEPSFFCLMIDGHCCEKGSTSILAAPRNGSFHPCGEEHVIEFDAALARCFIVELQARAMSLANDGVCAPPRLLHTSGGSLDILLASLYREFRHGDASSPLAMQGIVLQLLANVTRSARRTSDPRPSWLVRAGEVLRQRFRERLTIEDIATDVGVQPSHLSAAFRQHHHRTIGEEQRRLRVEFACRRMIDRNATLAEIASDAGFSDQPHFSRTFKQETGLTPAEYRAGMR
jgi:AraC family transcriptional regulator